MKTLSNSSKSIWSATDQQIRKNVLLAFCHPFPEQCVSLSLLSSGQWQKLLYWLDTSGLALYFLDRLREANRTALLPAEVHTRLLQNLADNTQRMHVMMAEAIELDDAFRRAGVYHAILKGFSLWPCSVPRLELRSQLDLDFLVAEESAPAARSVLESLGYRLHAISAGTWEFKANQATNASLKELYRATPSRCIELHLESKGPGSNSRLSRTEERKILGTRMRVLASADLFLWQGLHLFKHISGEFSRAAHIIEYRRHVLARRHDIVFWHELQKVGECNARASFGLGIVTLIITQLMGSFAPAELTCWTVDRLPKGARLWVQLYGERVALCGFPGSKLYLLLHNEMQAAGVPARRSVRASLFPGKLPGFISGPKASENPGQRIRRYRAQLSFLLFRLRFHILEGLRYAWESHRWNRRVRSLAS